MVMNWFGAPRQGPVAGKLVASVGSFLRGCSKDEKHANWKVKQWTNGTVPRVDKTCFPKMKLEHQRGDKGAVATKGTFRRVYPYV